MTFWIFVFSFGLMVASFIGVVMNTFIDARSKQNGNRRTTPPTRCLPSRSAYPPGPWVFRPPGSRLAFDMPAGTRDVTFNPRTGTCQVVTTKTPVLTDQLTGRAWIGDALFVLPKGGLPAIERALPEAGEIIAYRMWLWPGVGSALFSLGQQIRWQPGQPVEATPAVKDWGESGIYAAKSPGLFWSAGSRQPFWLVCGRVRLWGTVIEHQLGYRAQYAAVHAIDHVDCPLPISSCLQWQYTKHLQQAHAVSGDPSLWQVFEK